MTNLLSLLKLFRPIFPASRDALLRALLTCVSNSLTVNFPVLFSNIPKLGLIGVEEEPYADTMLCPNSKKAILRSCGAGIAAADDLMNKNERIFCAIRPPGHHAESSKAMGFC